MMKTKRLAAGVLAFALYAGTVIAQDGDKAVMVIQNYEPEPVMMRFFYEVGDYSWSLMERQISVDSDLTYKFPTGLPGCEYLIDWDIDKAVLTIESAMRGEICRQEMSLCEKREVGVRVARGRCTVTRP